jgi:hypothetical protein
VCPDAVGRPESDQNPALPLAPFTIYWALLASTAAINGVDDAQLAAPEVHTSIEYPYPDRVRRKREAASFKRPYLK